MQFKATEKNASSRTTGTVKRCFSMVNAEMRDQIFLSVLRLRKSKYSCGAVCVRPKLEWDVVGVNLIFRVLNARAASTL